MRRGRSFRLRLALGSALLAGLALAGFVAAAWWQLDAARVAALDRTMRDQAERELRRSWPVDHWAPHERNLASALGARRPGQALLLVEEGGRLIYRSAHWPAGLDPAALPWPTAQPPGAPSPGPLVGDHWGGGWEPSPAPRSPTGRSVSGDTGPGQPPPPWDDRPPRPALAPAFAVHTRQVGSAAWRLGLAAAGGTRMAIGVDLAVADAELARVRTAFLLAVPLALVLIGAGAWFLSARALSPLRRLTDTMAGITAKGLDQRLAAGGEDREFGRLIAVFNGMLERLERSFMQASRFSADAAHELKTPLAVLQVQLEQALAEAEPGSAVQGRLSGILAEVQRLAAIARRLLLLALADAGRLRLHRTDCDLSRTIADLREDAELLAPGLDVQVEAAPGLVVQADAALLRQVLQNLLGNAAKHNRPGGFIRITAGRRGPRVLVEIANASVDLPAAARAHLFERFYRAESARERRTEGVGLGLSLAREIARAHGGDLELAPPVSGETAFRLWLPARR